jgi:hypothetical protein
MDFERDFGPRLMSYMVRYGPKVWTTGNYYFWVPIVTPFIGCAFRGFCMMFLSLRGRVKGQIQKLALSIRHQNWANCLKSLAMHTCQA